MKKSAISSTMTLPELISVADKFNSGNLSLSPRQLDYLVALLTGYADEILTPGQCIQLETVILTKTLSGTATAKLSTPKNIAEAECLRECMQKQ